MKKHFIQIQSNLVRCGAFSAPEHRILLVLISLKPCYPSHSNLAEWTNLNIKTVKNTLKILKSKGLITWVRGHGFGKNNCYRIDHKALSKLTSDWGSGRALIGGLDGLLNKTIKEIENDLEEIELSYDVPKDAEMKRIFDMHDQKEWLDQSLQDWQQVVADAEKHLAARDRRSSWRANPKSSRKTETTPQSDPSVLHKLKSPSILTPEEQRQKDAEAKLIIDDFFKRR